MDRLAGVATTIERDPAAAAAAAGRIAASARESTDWVTASRAEATRGRALRMLGEIALAEQALRLAIEAARAAGDDELEGDAQLALGGVLSASGRHDEAFAALEIAEHTGSPIVRERAVLQRAAVCRDVRRLDESLRLFDAALAGLRAPGRELDLARVQANRGGLLLYRGDPYAATAAFEEAVTLLNDSGHEFILHQVLHDLGCAIAHVGDLPRALDLFEQASAGMAALGHDASLPLLSRAEALLRAGLSSDALPAAADAARRLDAEGNGFAAAQALVALAEACRLEGDDVAALDAAQRASNAFAHGGADGWAHAAAIESIRTRARLGTVSSIDVDRLAAIADGLAATGDVRTEVAARCLTGVIAAGVGDTARGHRELARVVAIAQRAPLLEFDVGMRHAEAVLAQATGDGRMARACLLAALDAIETANAVFGGTAANAALATGGRDVADAALDLAAADPDPIAALELTERVRVVAGGAPATAAGGDAEEYGRLRAITAELRRAERDGTPTDELRHAQSDAERHLRDRWLRHRPPGREATTLRFDAERLLGDATGRAVVSVAVGRHGCSAVVVEAGRCRRVALAAAAEIIGAAERASTAFAGAVAGGATAVVAARRRVLDATVATLDALVLQPLAITADEVVIAVPPSLVALPWAATPTLAHRRFSLVPSIAWWQRANASPVADAERVLVVAGPRLAEADAEATGVAECHPDATLLTGDGATVAATVAAMARCDVAHIVAHGRFRHDNPLWSTIELADGPLSMHELRGLDRVPPTVVVATCESAVAGGRWGADLQGLAATLLDLGARTVVASTGPLPDDARTRATMIAVHRDLRAGIGPSESLRGLRAAQAGEPDLTAAALVTIGAGA